MKYVHFDELVKLTLDAAGGANPSAHISVPVEKGQLGTTIDILLVTSGAADAQGRVAYYKLDDTGGAIVAGAGVRSLMHSDLRVRHDRKVPGFSITNLSNATLIVEVSIAD